MAEEQKLQETIETQNPKGENSKNDEDAQMEKVGEIQNPQPEASRQRTDRDQSWAENGENSKNDEDVSAEQVVTETASPEERPPSAPLPEDSPPALQQVTPPQAEIVQESTSVKAPVEEMSVSTAPVSAGRQTEPEVKTEVLQTPPQTQNQDRNKILGLLGRARAKIQEKRRKKLDRIMTELAEKGRITNDEIEKLLHVSDSTATRYMNILEKEGKVRQVGTTGRHVFYEKIGQN